MMENGEETEVKELEKGYDYDINVTNWVEGQVPKHRTKLDRSVNRGKYIELLLAGMTYRELVMIAKNEYSEDISIRCFSEFNNRIPPEVKNPLTRMEKFVKEAPYRVNEILMLEELIKKQRERFKLSGELENKAKVPFSSRSQVARDLHSMLVDLQEAKMKAGLIQRAPERIEITGAKSISQYDEEEKKKEMERINAKLSSVRKDRESGK